MPCTTILVGKKASFDGSTLVARNEDSGSGEYNAKKFVFVKKETNGLLDQVLLVASNKMTNSFSRSDA